MSVFQETQNSEQTENSDNKTAVYSSFLSNLLKKIRKSHYVFFLVKNGKYPTQIRAFNFTTVDYIVYWTFKITLSSIGFEWKKVLIC